MLLPGRTVGQKPLLENYYLKQLLCFSNYTVFTRETKSGLLSVLSDLILALPVDLHIWIIKSLLSFL